MKKLKNSLALLLILIVQVSSLPVDAMAQELDGMEFGVSSGTTEAVLKFVENASGLTFTEDMSAASVSALPKLNHNTISEDPIAGTVHELTRSQQAVLSAQTRGKTMLGQLIKKHFRVQEKVSVKIEYPNRKSEIKTSLIDPDGKETEVMVEKKVQDNFMEVTVLPPTHFRPGNYKLIVEDTATGQKTVQDFTWGVLAINTNKSVYLPGEKAKLSIGVLDDKGRMVCDAIVSLKIQNVKVDTLSTENGTIQVNPECESKDFTLTPDYQAEYEVGQEGTYNMELTATHQNGTYTITDSFDAKNNIPFDIERTTATRIYPAHKYPVKISVTAKENFTGTIIETVPENFGVEQTDQKIQYDEVAIVPAFTTPSSTILGANDTLSLPFKGNRKLTAGFGEEVSDPVLAKKYKEFHLLGHDGIDFDMPIGTEVIAVTDGEVVLAEEDHDYGMTLVIQHKWGKSYYGHLSKIEVTKGQKVPKGYTVALSGNSGLSTDGHLHFGIKLDDHNMKNGYYGKIDPSPMLGLTEVEEVLGARSKSGKNAKQIIWKVQMKKGETVQLSYSYQAPYESPQFYTLGPVQMFQNNDLIYGETRQWQIAVDDTATYTISDGSSTATLTSGACDTSQTNGTASDGAQGTVIRSECVGRSDVPVVKWNKTLTWESMGIPAGSTITQVDGSFKYRVVSESHTATQAMGTMQLRDSSDSADCAASVLEASFDPGAVNASFTTRNASGAINVSAGCQASSTSVTIRLNMSPATGNNASATSELRADDISLSITYTPPAPNLTQIHSRWRNDDGSESTATWRRSEDVAATAAVDALRRIRLEVSNEGFATATGTTYRIEFGVKASTCAAIGTWTAVPTTSGSAFIMTDSSNLTDAGSTTNVASGLTDENTTFVAGQVKDTGNTTAGISLTTTQFTELEYSLKPTVNATLEATYCFRVTNAGSTTNFTYTAYPELTVGEPNLIQNHYRWRNDDGGQAALTGQTITLHPTGQGNYTAWASTGCTDNTAEWDCVNDNNTASGTPGANDGTTTHLTTTTGSARSSFSLDNDLIPASATVTQLQIFMDGAEVSAAGGDATVTAFYRLNSSDTNCAAGASAFGGTTYTTQSCTYSSLSLTPTDINNLEIGILFGANDPSISKVYVTVTYNTTGATWKQNEDTAHSGQVIDENIRLRVQAANSGDIAAIRNLLLEYAEQTGGTCGDETFVSVPVAAGSPFEMVTSTYVTNGEATTALLTSAGGSFVAGEMVEDPSNSPGGISVAPSNGYIEVEYVIQAASSASEKTYCFRVSDNGAALDSYSVYPILSVAVSGPSLDQLMRHGKWFNSGVEQAFTF